VLVNPSRGSAERALVSVCVPLYNHKAFVGALLDSIHADPYPNKEIIVIDDGSTDGSFEELEAWHRRVVPQYRCEFLRQGNAGISVTLNRTLACAKGEYCAVVASDDVLVPGGIAVRQRALAERPELTAVFGDARVIDRSGAVVMASGLSDLYGADKSRYHTRQSLLFEIVVRWSVPGPVLMARREALIAMGGYSPGYLEDYDLYVRLADAGKLGFVDEVVAEYRLHGANVSRSGDSVVKMRRALMRACVKNLGPVRPVTKAFLLARLAMSGLQMVIGKGTRFAKPTGA
jgi:glycosyltransferase involved in cell wall biosynthesis